MFRFIITQFILMFLSLKNYTIWTLSGKTMEETNVIEEQPSVKRTTESLLIHLSMLLFVKFHIEGWKICEASTCVFI